MSFEDLQKKWAGQFRDPREGEEAPAEAELLRRVHEGERRFQAMVVLGILRDLAFFAGGLIWAWITFQHAVLDHSVFLRLRSIGRAAVTAALLFAVLGIRFGACLDPWWTARAARDRSRVSSSVLRDRDRFDALILWRDLREALAGVLVVSIAVFQAYSSDSAHFPGLAWTAVAFFTLPIIGFVTYRFRSSDKPPVWDGTLVGMLAVSIHQTRRQVRLLDNLWWYIAPLYAGFLLGGPIRQSLIKGGVRLPQIVAAIGMLALLYGVWRLNRWVARRRLQPRLDHLEGLRTELIGN